MFRIFAFLLIVSTLVITWAYSGDKTDPAVKADGDLMPVRIRVTPSSEADLSALGSLRPYQVSEIPASEIGRGYDYELPGDRVAYLEKNTIPHDILSSSQGAWNDEDYFSYQEVYDQMLLTTLLYPDIAVMESLGVSERDSVTIWALKISDNPQLQENEPDAHVDGLIHAREPVTVNICMALIDSLTWGYGINPDITHLIDETEIWIVPIKNPEGYLYVETGIPYPPAWRKNKRDNDADGIFEGVVYEYCGNEYPSMPDGVDLNRNYAEGWNTAGSPDSCSIVYHGPSPFSESETRTERALVERERPVVAVSLHSYSEYVGYCGQDAAGQELCQDMASAINRLGGYGTYDCSFFYGSGQSYNWMYWEYGVQGYLIETATEFFPSGEDTIGNVVMNNVNGILTMLYRVHGSSIRGNVYDSETLEPLVADVSVSGEPLINIPRTSEPNYGRFTRLVLPGTYTVQVQKEGYESYTLGDIVVEEGIPTVIEIPLVNTASGIEGDTGESAPPAMRTFSVAQNYPNPFNPSTTFQFAVPETEHPVGVQVSIYDLRGRLIRTLMDEKKSGGIYRAHWDGTGERGESVPSGVYFYRVRAGDFQSTKKMMLTR